MFMNLSDLEQRIQEETERYIEVHGVLVDISNIKPLPEVNITRDYLQEKLGRKWKACLNRMAPIVKWFIQHYYGTPVMFSTYMLRDMRNGKSSKNGAMRSCNALQDLLNLKVIKCVYKSYNPEKDQARLYICDSHSLHTIYSNYTLYNNIPNISNNTHIDSNTLNTNLYTYLSMNNDSEQFKKFRDETDEVLEEDENQAEEDPIIKHLRSTIRDLCKIQNNLEEDPRFKYSLHKDKSYRPYSPFCSIPTRKKEHKIQHETYREDILGEEYHELDRIASIYNLNRYIQKGEISGNNRQTDDFYREFYECKTEEDRNNVKLIMMTLMFGTPQQFNSSCQAVIGYHIDGNTRDRVKAFKFGKRFVAICKLIGTKHINHDTVKLMNKWRKEQVEKLERIIGTRIGKSIFLYEAYVNLGTEIDLRNAGYKCLTVYDGFYTDAPEEIWWEKYRGRLLLLSTLISSYSNTISNNNTNTFNKSNIYTPLSMINDSNYLTVSQSKSIESSQEIIEKPIDPKEKPDSSYMINDSQDSSYMINDSQQKPRSPYDLD